MMLSVRQLLRQTGQAVFGPQGRRTLGQNLIKYSNKVSVAFNTPKVGKDPRGYYRAVLASARTNEAGKKTKRIELRFYWPKGRAKADTYIPDKLRQNGVPYFGPTEAPKFDLDTPVWVQCNCEWFLYNAEVANAESDNSTIKYSNGKAPVINNPREIQHLCKHLISAIRKGALLKK